MSTRFKGKVALITGAGSGIGRCTALQFGREAAQVACTDVDIASAEETAKLIRETGGTATAILCDVSDEETVNRCVAKCVAEFGSLQILCNVAGIAGFTSMEDHPTKEWRRFLSINLDGHVAGQGHQISCALEIDQGCVRTGPRRSRGSGGGGCPGGVAVRPCPPRYSPRARLLMIEAVLRFASCVLQSRRRIRTQHA